VKLDEDSKFPQLGDGGVVGDGVKEAGLEVGPSLLLHL
jgi:hypothetical protein